MATPAGSLGLYPNRVATTTASEGTFKRVRAVRVPASQTGNSLTGICKKRLNLIITKFRSVSFPIRRVF
jgi:hypothetical protein